MKKLIVALSTIFFTILIMVSIYTLIPKNNSISAESEVQTGYIIADFGGKVAVFEEGCKEPAAVYDIYTHLLPENDIELLRKGIHVDNLNQLQSRLEDLGL
ncbi:MAG: hypothetical protein IJN69_02295 [Oscillospiraceae bacterium]|nr:hypothetical protein [Oscillospiraceae bacterium]